MKESNTAVLKQTKEGARANPGFVTAVLLAVLAAATFGVAMCTPPISGPFVTGGIPYPYADIASRFPRDYYWMYPAIALVLAFVILTVCIDQHTSGGKKLYSRIAVAFACLSAGIISLDYFMQVSIIQPAVLNGETDGIALWTQYNPHGAFIVLEEFGYILMSISLLFLALVFKGRGAQNKIRWTGILCFAATVATLVIMSVLYGVLREYRFEVVVIAIDLTALILLGIFTGQYFRKEAAENQS